MNETVNDKGWKLTKLSRAHSGIAEIYSRGMEFALASADGKQCHPFVYCKDFLQDAVWGFVNKRRAGIYGFWYDPKEDPPIDLEKTRILIKDSTRRDLGNKLAASLKLMNEIEKELGIKRTIMRKIEEVDFLKETYVFTGSAVWLRAPMMLSFYSFLIRAGMNYKGGEWRKYLEARDFPESNDQSYAESSNGFWDKFLSKETTSVLAKLPWNEGYKAGIQMGTMHNGGFVNGQERFKEMVKK